MSAAPTIALNNEQYAKAIKVYHRLNRKRADAKTAWRVGNGSYKAYDKADKALSKHFRNVILPNATTPERIAMIGGAA